MKTRALLKYIRLLSALVFVTSVVAQENQETAKTSIDAAVTTVAASGSGEHPLARDLLRELIEINTTLTHGSTLAAEAMAKRLRSSGFAASDALLLGPRSDRQNLVARLRGSDSMAEPILLIAHLDVVDAPREGWLEGLDPFLLTERDGFFYGRGVLDNKSAGACLIANLIKLRAEGFIPNRDIIVALTADEEAGNANGISWLLYNHRDLIDAAFCLNLDGGGGQMEKGQRLRMTIETSQKIYVSFRVETSSPGGHSSMPIKDNAIYRLAAGLVRLSQYEFPFRFNETTRTYFERLSKLETGTTADDLKAVAQDPPDLDAARRLAAESPFLNATLRTTAVATRIQAGHADNALPQTAFAVINCRMFPGDTIEFVKSELIEGLADPNIKVSLMGAGRSSPVSPLLPEVIGAIEQLSQEMWPSLPVLPIMSPWASDAARVSRAGIPTYGVTGFFSETDMGNAHGANERLPVDSFYEGIEFIYRLLKTLTGGSHERQKGFS